MYHDYRIISAVIDAIRTGENQKVFAPGVFGHIGGYPVMIGYKEGKISAWIEKFPKERYENKNQSDDAGANVYHNRKHVAFIL